MIELIDEYSPFGNGQQVINNNFEFLNIRTCLANDIYIKTDDMFTKVQALSSRMNSMCRIVTNLSAKWIDTSSIVHNVSGYWMEPVMLTYENTFSGLANFSEIETWLDTTFGASTFNRNQILSVSYAVKNYNPTIIANAPLPVGISTDQLNTLASNYNQSFKDVQQYLGYVNIINTIISSINGVLKITNNKTLLIKDISELKTYYDSFFINNGVLSSTLLVNISDDFLKTIYVYLEQYMIIKEPYDALVALGIKDLPTNVLNTLNIQNIFTMFLGKFCFRLNASNKWKYSPTCNINFCTDQLCSDCFEFVDPNTLYTDGCNLSLKYQLTTCEGDIYTSGNPRFDEFLDSYVDMVIDGVSQKVFVEAIRTDIIYPNSSVLLSNRYVLHGSSVLQFCLDGAYQMTLVYSWSGTGMSDLDTSTRAFGENVGWSCPDAIGGTYLQWITGDDTSADGREQVDIRVDDARLAGLWSTSYDIECYAGWYIPAGGSGPATMEVTYRGTTKNAAISPSSQSGCAGAYVMTITVYSSIQPDGAYFSFSSAPPATTTTTTTSTTTLTPTTLAPTTTTTTAPCLDVVPIFTLSGITSPPETIFDGTTYTCVGTALTLSDLTFEAYAISATEYIWMSGVGSLYYYPYEVIYYPATSIAVSSYTIPGIEVLYNIAGGSDYNYYRCTATNGCASANAVFECYFPLAAATTTLAPPPPPTTLPPTPPPTLTPTTPTPTPPPTSPPTSPPTTAPPTTTPTP